MTELECGKVALVAILAGGIIGVAVTLWILDKLGRTK